MKRRWMCLMLALCLLVGTGCGESRPEDAGEYVLYFRAVEEGHGPALKGEPYTGQLTPEAMVRALLAGPTEESLRSPFPRGVTLNGCAFDQNQPGRLKLSLSERYGELTDIDLTLADYCLVLTLSQLEEVETVEIISGGHAASYRSHAVLSAAEAVLSDQGEESSS